MQNWSLVVHCILSVICTGCVKPTKVIRRPIYSFGQIRVTSEPFYDQVYIVSLWYLGYHAVKRTEDVVSERGVVGCICICLELNLLFTSKQKVVSPSQPDCSVYLGVVWSQIVYF